MNKLKNTADRYCSVSYTYIIRNKLGLLKIGRSDNPEQRLKTIEANSGVPCTLEYTIKGSFIEQAAHKELKKYREVGEWFNCSLEIAVEVIERLREEKVNEIYESMKWWEEKKLKLEEDEKENKRILKLFKKIKGNLKEGDYPECTKQEERAIRKLALNMLVDHFGNSSKLAEYLGTTPSTVQGWNSRGNVGKHYALVISKDHNLNKLFPYSLLRFGLKS